MSEKAIFFDTTRCSGCKACQVACKCWNELPSPLKKNSQEWSTTFQNPADLKGDTRLIMTYREADNGKNWGIFWAFGRRSCMHCKNPGCVSVCPSGALFVDEDTQLVSFDSTKCIGCQFCRSACPFDVPRHSDVDVFSGNIKINKCTGCLDRVSNGMEPACVNTCQPMALSFGDREEMIALAKERLEFARKRGYENARIYGVDELEGCHVIHLLKYDISQYELPEEPKVPAAVKVSNVVKPLAAVGAAAVVAGLGISFATGTGYKRDELHFDEKAHDVVDVDTGEVVKHIDIEAGER